ncbi:MAG: hypothetical protein KDC07_06455, partial [Chitinophagaceae bacterium]|nr:hypothetical protein [Chitinophagaceae bacterium]
NVFFKNVPTADGNYKVVFKPQDSLAADEVFLSAGLYATSSTYMPAGIDNITAKVTMVNGKIKFELPDTKVFTTKPSDDTTTLSGVIIEQ